MEIESLRKIIELINPWIESVILFFVYLFIIMILARLTSEISNKLLKYFNIKNEYFPEAFEYLTYLLGLIIMLTYFGIFKLAIIVVLSFIGLVVIVGIIFALYSLIPEIIAGKKLNNKIIEKAKYSKNYKKGILNTTFMLTEYEKLVVPNSKLFNDFNR